MKVPNLEKRTLYNLVQEGRRLYGDLPVQSYKDGKKIYSDISYNEFVSSVESLSRGLLYLNANSGDRIGIIADVGHQWLQVSMAITNIGCVDVPRGTDATFDDIAYILAHANCKIVFIENEKTFLKFLPELKKLKIETIILFGENRSENTELGFPILNFSELKRAGVSISDDKFHSRGKKIQEEDLATIIYTSGTTGKPKGVMLTHGSILFEIHSLVAEFRKTGVSVGEGDVTLGFLPPWHSGERIFETICFYSGIKIAFTTVAELGKDLAKAKPTILFTVPRVWESFYDKIRDSINKSNIFKKYFLKLLVWNSVNFSICYDLAFDKIPRLNSPKTNIQFLSQVFHFIKLVMYLPLLPISKLILSKILSVLGGRLRYAFAGAGALQAEVDRFMYAIGMPILEVYGMTENSGVSTIRHYNDFSVGNVGKPIEGVTIKLIDEYGKEITKPGIKGVALHHGFHNMKGYYLEEEKTKAVLTADRWLNSGDLLVYTAQGSLKFAGRAKDTIVLSGGENVEPEPIEICLKQSEYIEQAVVVGQDKKTLSVLILLNLEKVQSYLNLHSISLDLNHSIYNEEENLQKLIKEEVKKYISDKNGFKSFERISNIYILQNPFVVHDELTQTQKVKRNRVQEKYHNEIESMYRK
ncbi:AMP-binding protein [Leptospira sp. 2 VSF19]|uniref:AMP-binding protein n=1 Tax=Leptospira soteropolitanensis TaxID=2950025 RepID=A0AAW5VGM2_9LEPT|nr:AMP-binding protein [Leptospira soteropolitanensis]MCW7491652.1 AMP-binding protein [Leptospira soteropolitanensis]MCW7499236.1 AMP-binding protein [Leptospira soteropolitanensis]MCW7521172.1 AMP-binding protein [Leptospira soteropolitanensis]MCW7525340.1 AMP-binding protein [Leptospira soteropolitanensis]MCW7529207.1 AMP-binding protein [Leptospira soteropolitanensis]